MHAVPTVIGTEPPIIFADAPFPEATADSYSPLPAIPAPCKDVCAPGTVCDGYSSYPEGSCVKCGGYDVAHLPFPIGLSRQGQPACDGEQHTNLPDTLLLCPFHHTIANRSCDLDHKPERNLP
jgi:hypothetical protein